MTLARAIDSGRIGQAYVFAGQRGVGKTSAARILAKCLNCATGPTSTPCQTCPSCEAITRGNHLDVIEIDGASNRGIDDIRQLRDQVRFAAVQGAFKIYIIDEVHQITPDAFNALLKTLEEPPAHVKFIFATTVPQKVPPTILSRCQRFDFRRVDNRTVVGVLQRVIEAEGVRADERALYAVARASDGSLRDAEVMLEQLASFCEGAITERDVTQLLGDVEHDVLSAWADALLGRDVPAALSLLAQQVEQGKEPVQILTGLLWHLRHLLIARATAHSPARAELLARLIDLPDDARARLDAQSANATVEELIVMSQVLAGAYELARRSPFAQAIIECALIQAAMRESWASLEQMLQRLERAAPGTTTAAPARAEAPAPPATAAPSSARAEAPPVSQDAVAQPASPTGEVTLDALAARWPNVIQRIGEQKMSLAAYLSETKPLSVAQQQVEVGIPPFPLHQEILNLPETMRLLERTLSEQLGRALSVRYSPLPEPPAGSAPEAALPPVVRDIVKLFDARILPQPPSVLG